MLEVQQMPTHIPKTVGVTMATITRNASMASTTMEPHKVPKMKQLALQSVMEESTNSATIKIQHIVCTRLKGVDTQSQTKISNDDEAYINEMYNPTHPNDES